MRVLRDATAACTQMQGPVLYIHSPQCFKLNLSPCATRLFLSLASHLVIPCKGKASRLPCPVSDDDCKQGASSKGSRPPLAVQVDSMRVSMTRHCKGTLSSSINLYGHPRRLRSKHCYKCQPASGLHLSPSCPLAHPCKYWCSIFNDALSAWNDLVQHLRVASLRREEVSWSTSWPLWPSTRLLL